MESNDQRNFFETDTQQAKRLRRKEKESNTFGNPIKASTKILAVIPDPRPPHSSIFIAESGGRVSQVNIESRTITAKYRGPSNPLTCLATGGPSNGILFAGSWDKTVWSWDIASQKPLHRYDGHSDFVKAVVCARLGGQGNDGRDVLISGGADKKILVWDVASGKRLCTLQDPGATMLAIQSLAVDPVLSTKEDGLVLVSASSDPVMRRWRVRADGTGGELISQETNEEGPNEAKDAAAIREHETSVYKVMFDLADEEVDLWTASADGTAKCLARGKGFAAEDTFEHGDFVKALAVAGGYVVTGGFSQDIKVWDRTAGTLLYTLEGHFDEITDCAVLRDPTGNSAGVVCSVSIDRTIRTWPLEKASLDAVVQEIKRAGQPDGEDQQEARKEDSKGEGLMTAEEEAELAALMGED